MIIRRRDPVRRMARFYFAAVQPDLFGGCGVVREWGRIGSPGTARTVTYPTEAQATAVCNRTLARKQRRGYR